MIRNVIFDFGNVLLPIDEGLTWQALKDLGAQEELKDQKKIFQKFEKGKSSKDEFLEEMQAFFFRKKIFKDDIAAAWNSMIFKRLPDENIDLLKKLKKTYNLYLLSNTNQLHLDKIKKDAGHFRYAQFCRLFQKTYFSFEMGMRKPDTEIFEKIMAENSLKPAETFYVDDGRQHVKTAEKLNIRTWRFDPDLDSILEIENYIGETEKN